MILIRTLKKSILLNIYDEKDFLLIEKRDRNVENKEDLTIL